MSHLLRQACRGMHRRRSSRILGAGTRSYGTFVVAALAARGTRRPAWALTWCRELGSRVYPDLWPCVTMASGGSARSNGGLIWAASSDSAGTDFDPVRGSFDLGRPVGVGSPAERPVSAHHHWEVTARVWR